MPGLKNPGDCQLFRQNHVAQFVDRFLFFLPLRILKFLNAVEDLAEIAWRINCHLIAYIGAESSRQLNPEHRRFAFKIKFSESDELLQRNHFLFLLWIDTSNHRCESPVVKFHNHGALHIRGGGNNARSPVDFRLERSPIAHHVLGGHENVGVEIDYLLAQLPIKPGHDRNHEDKHHHAEHHANDRNQCDDRQKRALRLQVSERQEKTKRQFQFALSVAANSVQFNRASIGRANSSLQAARNASSRRRARSDAPYLACCARQTRETRAQPYFSACAVSSSSVTNSSAEAWVASRSTGAARLWSSALFQRVTHTHHLSPGVNPGKPHSGRGVIRSLPSSMEKSKNSCVTFTQTVC